MLLDILRDRRSIRQFGTNPVEEEKVNHLIEAMLRSPSSRGLDPWEFVVVTDQELITGLAKAKPHGSAFLRNAPLAIAVCADPEKCDVWVEDTAIAAIILHLTAADLGLGSCWVQIRKRDHTEEMTAEQYVADLLQLKPGMVVEAIIGIGYPGENKAGHAQAKLKYDRVHYNLYGQGPAGG